MVYEQQEKQVRVSQGLPPGVLPASNGDESKTSSKVKQSKMEDGQPQYIKEFQQPLGQV